MNEDSKNNNYVVWSKRNSKFGEYGVNKKSVIKRRLARLKEIDSKYGGIMMNKKKKDIPEKTQNVSWGSKDPKLDDFTSKLKQSDDLNIKYEIGKNYKSHTIKKL